MDVRVGGTRLVCMEMSAPGGSIQMWFAGEYLEVVENQRLVYTESMSDEHGNPLSGAETCEAHAMTTRVRLDLEDLGGGTKMVMTHTAFPATHRAQPDGRWRSTSSRRTSRQSPPDERPQPRARDRARVTGRLGTDESR